MVPCVKCGGKMHFDIESQKMKCLYCGTYAYVSDMDQKSKNAEETMVPADVVGFENNDSYEKEIERKLDEGESYEEIEVTVFTCSQCGAEIVSDDTDAAGFCSFCGSPVTLIGHMSRIRKPDFVIPFTITKEQCEEKYRKELKKKPYVSKEFLKNGGAEKIRGIYIPYWMYEVTYTGPYAFIAQEKGYFKYMISGDLDARIKGFQHDASIQMKDDISEYISPYRMSDVREFSSCYLNGFYADAADIMPGKYRKQAEQIAEEEMIRATKSHHPLFDISDEQVKFFLDKGMLGTKKVKAYMGMLPVWFYSYKLKDGRVSYMVMNGQTGKMFSDAPMNSGKIIRKGLAISAAASAILLFAVYILKFPYVALASFSVTAALWGYTKAINQRSFMLLKKKEKDKEKEKAKRERTADFLLLAFSQLVPFFSFIPLVLIGVFFIISLIIVGMKLIAELLVPVAAVVCTCELLGVMIWKKRAGYSFSKDYLLVGLLAVFSMIVLSAVCLLGLKGTWFGCGAMALCLGSTLYTVIGSIRSYNRAITFDIKKIFKERGDINDPVY